jgi:hypothetical protein
MPKSQPTGTHIVDAPTRAAWSTMRADRRFLWLWLTVSTSLSVGGNIGHAWITVAPGITQWMAIGWAAAPPALLMLAIHGLPTLARMLDSDKRDTLLTAVVWGVTIGAFGWSAFGIFGFSTALGVPAQMAWVAPFVIDLSVFGATRGLVLTAPLAARMKIGLTTAAAGRSPAASQAPSSLHDAAAGATPDTSPAAAFSPGVASDPVAGPPPSPVPAPPQLPAGGSSIAAEKWDLAERIVASGRVRKPVETVAAILSAAEGERRIATIAKLTGVHHSVVTKTLEAA